jgi:hypothetical protein
MAILQREYSPDALIQAAKDRLGLVPVLADELYANLIATIPVAESVTLIKRALTARNIAKIGRTDWQAFIDVMLFHFPRLTALGVAAA